jgi:hypothetical protein
MSDTPNELLDSSTGLILHEMLATIEDELREGSTLNERFDSFKSFFELIFDMSIDEIEDVEETIQNDNSLIDIYNEIRRSIAATLDNYFGITFEDLEKVYLENLYYIYQVVYLKYIQFLYMYAIGQCISQNKTTHEVFKEAEEAAVKENVEIADYMLGKYILDENEFTSENIAGILDKADPGNLAYLYLFGEPVDPKKINEGPLQTVYIDNNAFRLRIKKEYLNPGIKYCLETIFRKNIK